MKYEIYQLKEDTMEQVKLRFMASDQPHSWAASTGRTTAGYTAVRFRLSRKWAGCFFACSHSSTGRIDPLISLATA